MVLHPETEESINQLFRALADGTRRDILARSLTETPSVSDLASRYEMSFAAVRKHVAVLERAGLIRKRPNGREQLVSTNLARLERAGEVLDHFESIWRQRMAQLDDVLLAKGPDAADLCDQGRRNAHPDDHRRLSRLAATPLMPSRIPGSSSASGVRRSTPSRSRGTI